MYFCTYHYDRYNCRIFKKSIQILKYLVQFRTRSRSCTFLLIKKIRAAMTFEKNKTEHVHEGGGIKLRNPNIDSMNEDILYHLALSNKSHDLVEMFGDIKFVCMGGSVDRMEKFANYAMKEIGYKVQTGTSIQNISSAADTYAMFKIGPILSVSHGMGVSSLTTLLHEITKLMYHAKVKDPIFFRIGTSGGIGVEPGSVVITNEAVNEELKPIHKVTVLGRIVERPALLDEELVRELKTLASPQDSYSTIAGKTMCANDFYEAQARADGAFCEISENDKVKYFQILQENNVINIEMECTALASFTLHAGIRCAIVCATLVDRLKHDQIRYSKEISKEWQTRPQVLVMRFIKRHLEKGDFGKNHSVMENS